MPERGAARLRPIRTPSRAAAALAVLAMLAGCNPEGSGGGPSAEDDGSEHERLLAAGREPYMDHCSACHRADGKGIPGSYPKLDGSLVVLGPKDRHIDIVLNGKPNTVMPAFRNQLSDLEVAAILTYERNAWVFKAFDTVRPLDVANMRARTAPPAGR